MFFCSKGLRPIYGVRAPRQINHCLHRSGAAASSPTPRGCIRVYPRERTPPPRVIVTTIV